MDTLLHILYMLCYCDQIARYIEIANNAANWLYFTIIHIIKRIDICVVECNSRVSFFIWNYIVIEKLKDIEVIWQ